MRPATQLKDLGVTKSQSSRWQRKAALSAEEREALIEKAKKVALSVVERGPKKEGEPKVKKAPRLTIEAWEAATAEEREAFTSAVTARGLMAGSTGALRREVIMPFKPSQIVQAFGVKAFWAGLYDEQKDAFDNTAAGGA